MSDAGPDEDIEERPGWLYPLIIFLITAGIGAVILYLYVGPGLDELTGTKVKPTGNMETVQITIGNRRFVIPVNYIRLPQQRRDGPAGEVELNAYLPYMHGFTDADADAARDVTRKSPGISIILKAGVPELSERDRWERVYKPNANPTDPPFEYFGLTITPMSPQSGFADERVCTRQMTDAEFAVLRCTTDDNDHDIGGLCMREMRWGDGLTVTYGFRGGRLKEFQDIDAAMKEFLRRLEPSSSQ
jgi:hypothetical protein